MISLFCLSMKKDTYSFNYTLLEACKNGDLSLVEDLVSEGADVNWRCSPLIFSNCSNIERIKIYFDEMDKNKNTSLGVFNSVVGFFSKTEGETVSLIKKEVDGCSFGVCSNNLKKIINLDCFTYMVNKFLQQKEEEFNSPIHEAVLSGNYWLVKYLIDQGADFESDCYKNYPVLETYNGKYKAKWLSFPLCLAAKKGYLSIVKLLVKKGADPNCKDENGKMPIELALLENKYDVARLLLKKKT